MTREPGRCARRARHRGARDPILAAAAPVPAVTGRVTTPDGRPVPGVHVYPVGATRESGTHTDRDGQWTLTLPSGNWRIREIGHRSHDVHLAALDVDTATPDVAQAATPTRDDIARILARRGR